MFLNIQSIPGLIFARSDINQKFVLESRLDHMRAYDDRRELW